MIIDDFVKLVNKFTETKALANGKNPGGRPRLLSESELITLGIFMFYVRIPDVKHFYAFLASHYRSEFPTLYGTMQIILIAVTNYNMSKKEGDGFVD